MKVSWWTWLVISVSLSAGILAFAYFHYWQPRMTETQMNLEYADRLRAAAGKQKQANKRVKDAEEIRDSAAQQWAAIVATRTPGSSLASQGIDIGVHAWQLVIDSQKYRNSIQRAVNNQIKAGGVRVPQGPTIPDPDQNANTILSSFYNYPAIPFPVVIFDLGTVTVTGTYSQIKQNVEAWSRMPHYLAVTDGLQITGTSPTLTATYNLTIVGFIRAQRVSIPVPEGSAPSGGSGGGAPGGGGAGPGLGGGKKPGPQKGRL